MHQVARPAARADPVLAVARVISGQAGGVLVPRSLVFRCWAFEQQEPPYACDLVTPRGVPQPEVANLVQTLRQDMLKEPAHEFMPGNAAGPPLVRFALLVADRDGLIIKTNDTGIGDGDTKDVAGKVIQDTLLAFAPGRTLGYPGSGPDGLGDHQIGAALLKRGAELSAHEFGEGFHRDKERLARRMPALTVLGDAPAGDQTVDVGVIVKLLRPGMKNGEYADGAADMAPIAGEFDDRLGGRLHQHGVTIALVGTQHGAQFLRHRHGDVKVWRGQHLRLAGLEPAFDLVGMALGTAPVLAGMPGEHLGGAMVTAPEMPAERLGAAGLDISDGTQMRRRHRRAMGRQIAIRETSEDVRDLDHGRFAASEAGHQLIENPSERDAGRFGQVGIDGGRGDVGVAEQDLNNPGVDAVFQQPGRVTVAQTVGREPLFESGRGDRTSEGPAQRAGADRFGTVTPGKQPARVAMCPPQGT